MTFGGEGRIQFKMCACVSSIERVHWIGADLGELALKIRRIAF